MSDNFQDEFEVEVGKIVNIITEKATERVNERRVNLYKQEGEFVNYIQDRVQDDTSGKTLLIVVTTPMSQSEYKSTEEYKALCKIVFDNTYVQDGDTHFQVEVAIESNNTQGLPTVYNRYLNTDYLNYNVCFIHDDVTVYDNHIYEKLTKAHKTHEVVGLAGATKINLPFRADQPTAWHKLSTETVGKNVVRHQSGFVVHESDGKMWSTMFGVVPQDVKLIDGLFMSFSVEDCIKNGFTFDEDFTFHHYDLTASLRAIQCGMKLTTTDVLVKHKGLGEMGADWIESHKTFFQKYKDFNG